MNRCESCGQKIRKLNPHVMDRGKFSVLRGMADIHLNGHPWCKMQNDAARVPSNERPFTFIGEDVHWFRLSWFGLVESDGNRRSGYYRITDKGWAFLRGEETVPAKIWCREGKVVEVNEERLSVQEIKGIVLGKDYWDRYASFQKFG